jgi:hypothetical protein
MGSNIDERESGGMNGNINQVLFLSFSLGNDLETGTSKSRPSSITVTERAFP